MRRTIFEAPIVLLVLSASFCCWRPASTAMPGRTMPVTTVTSTTVSTTTSTSSTRPASTTVSVPGRITTTSILRSVTTTSMMPSTTAVSTVVPTTTTTTTMVPGNCRETARQILDRRKGLEDTIRHWETRYEHMTMRIVDRQGGERTRELEICDRRDLNDEQQTILFFLAPAEVKGTGFLSYTHKGRAAEQWLYLPEFKRVRQITARSRNESFVGSDLSYHDLDLIQEMGSWSEADAGSHLRGEDRIDGAQTCVIELEPHREDIGYKRIVLWLGRDDLVPRQLEFYGEAEQPLRRFRQRDVRSVGPIPVAYRADVETPKASTTTVIEITDVKFNQGLQKDVFTQHRLELGPSCMEAGG